MSDYGLLILIQIACIFIWVVVVKLKNSETPQFDAWLSRKIEEDPEMTVEQAFNEYILNYGVMNRSARGESVMVSEARTKLNLIEEYEIDRLLKGHDQYEGFKQSLYMTLGEQQEQLESSFAA